MLVWSGFAAVAVGTIEVKKMLLGYKRCVEEKRVKQKMPYKKEAYNDRGCVTGQADWWTGERDDCSQNVCWTAPPNHIILDAEIQSQSAAGSEHGFGETEYKPYRKDGGGATEICNTTWAWSHGRGGGRGWQKIGAVVTLQRVLTEADQKKIEVDCTQEVYEEMEQVDDNLTTP